MNDKNEIVQIYIYLLDEGVDVWRPVNAQRLQENIFLILEQPYDSDIEKWEFLPGDKVRCEYKGLSKSTEVEQTLVAVEKIA